MPSFDPDLLAEWSGGGWKNKPSGLISGFSIDSRSILEGEMFVAIEAERDGHDFLSKASENGARAALVKKVDLGVPIPQLVVADTLSAFHQIARGHRNEFSGSVVGITGSCGKTSTKDTLGLLMGKGQTLSTKGNLNNHLGVPLTILRMNDASHKFAIVEAGINEIGEMSMLARTISPDLVIVTLVGHSHLEGLGSIENVAREKAMLFEDSGSDPFVLFPEDCLSHELFSKRCESGKNHLVLKKGKPSRELRRNEAFYSIWTETNKNGGSWMLGLWRYESPFLSLPLPAVSAGMARNVALAVLAACELGVSVQEISDRLPQYRPSALRGRCFQGRGRTYFLDCYNANPPSMKDSIEFFSKQYSDLAKLYVLGGMEELGEEGPRLHHEVALSMAVKKRDRIVLIGEKASWMAEGLLEGGAGDDQVMVFPHADDAIALVEDFDGAVLFKGSRLNRLESLLPTWAVDERDQGDDVEC
jgi:UDP-N-acetylmuramoyl-tripeptide--D-alanyl-D-alanine ligase